MESFIDPGDYVESVDKNYYVMLKGTNDTRVIHVINKTLDLFKDMGMSDTDFLQEREKLVTNNSYFDFWCRDLPNWCPDLAYFVKI